MPDVLPERIRTSAPLLPLLLVLSFAWLPGKGIAEAEAGRNTQKVLLLHSYEPDLEWTETLSVGINRAFAESALKIDLYIEYMDGKRLPLEVVNRSYEAILPSKYDGLAFDLIITADDIALDFMLANRQRMFPGVPLVFCGVNDLSPARLQAQPQITGILEAIDVRNTLGLAVKLHPERRRLIVINDQTPTGQANRRILDSVLPAVGAQLDVHYWNDLTMAEISRRVPTLDNESMILLLSYTRDAAGNVFSYSESIAAIVAHSPVPIYGVWQFYLGQGIIGGKLLDGQRHGYKAGSLAVQVLQGMDPAQLPILLDRSQQWAFDARQMERFGIHRRQLPASAIVTNQPSLALTLPQPVFYALLVILLILCVLVIGLIVDIRKRLQTEAWLRASRERHRYLVEAMNDGLTILNSDGVFTYVNDRACQMLGQSRQDMLGAPITAFLDDANGQRFLQQQQERKAGQTTAYELWWKRSDGKSIPTIVSPTPEFDAEGGYRGSFAVLTDITALKETETELRRSRQELERRVIERTAELESANQALLQENLEREKAEQALRQREQKYRELYDLAPIGYHEIDSACAIVQVNQAETEMLGYSKDELIGRSVLELIVERDKAQAAIRHKLSGELPPGKSYERTLKRKNGTTFAALLSDRILRDDHGHVYGIRTVIEDITQRKQVEKSLQRYARELTRSNSDLQRFAYVASHDLQEPLRMVNSYMDLLVRRYKDNLSAEAQEFITFAIDGARRMQRLIDDLLRFSRVSTRSYEWQDVELSTVISDVLANLQVALEESQAEVNVESLPTLVADTSLLAQLFQNLLGNAIKFRGKEPPRIHISCDDAGDFWQLSIRDNGIGLDGSQADRIFEIFQRLHRSEQYSGTGIGLAICKRIVERHGGQIWVKSTPGQGATFFFTLPKQGHPLQIT